MIVTAPAKINLTLRILGKRPDGYHALESVMQTLALADTLHIEDGETLTFTCSEPSLAGEDNLVLRAARLLQARGGTRGARLHLEKRIPAQAGLGGGSSDAAAALAALDTFWDLRLPPGELAALAAQLGSDVPFFLNGPAAVVRGRGEQVRPFTHNANCSVVLVKPACGLSTPRVYAGLQAPPMPDEAPNRQPETRAMIAALSSRDCARVAAALVNDLEPSAFRLLPELGDLRARLLALGCLGVLLCGSGSCLCGICPDPATAERAAQAFNEYWTWAGSFS